MRGALQFDLTDSEGKIRKALQLGKVVIGLNNAIYHVGSATAADATALGDSLLEAGYLTDSNFRVLLIRDEGGAAIGFVVGASIANRWDAIQYLGNLGAC